MGRHKASQAVAHQDRFLLLEVVLRPHPGLHRVDEEGDSIAASLLVEWWPT